MPQHKIMDSIMKAKRPEIPLTIAQNPDYHFLINLFEVHTHHHHPMLVDPFFAKLLLATTFQPFIFIITYYIFVFGKQYCTRFDAARRPPLVAVKRALLEPECKYQLLMYILLIFRITCSYC